MTLQPQSVAELQEAVRTHDALTIRGKGTKSAHAADRMTYADGEAGHSADAGRDTLEILALSGITEYSPGECVFTALAGTPLRDITARLTAHGQYLPFDPPFVDAGATIGGTAAAGLSGSGRYRYGGVRDFVIGARVVDGEGRLIRSGGKVVKNAAGFLLHHAIVGSLGRFGVITELTFKVFPSPEARATLRVQCESVASALDTLRAVEGARFDVEAIDFDSAATMWIRVAGRAQALGQRIERLQNLVPWPSEILEGADDERLWAAAREFRWATSKPALVKIPITEPTRLTPGPSAVGEGPAIRYTCGGKCMWIADDDVNAVSAALSSANLRGLVVRGPRAGTLIGAVEPNVFEERVRSVLDPHNRFSAASHPAR